MPITVYCANCGAPKQVFKSGVRAKNFCNVTCRDTYIVPIEERFWKHVDKNGECWLWTANKHLGYGRIKRGPADGVGCIAAHRLSYEMAFGPIPEGMFVCHKCDNPSCVRPDHLFLGSPQDNVDDMYRKGRNNTPGARGASNQGAKLTPAQVEEIRARYLPRKVTQQALADEYGLNRVTILRIVKGQSWKQ